MSFEREKFGNYLFYDVMRQVCFLSCFCWLLRHFHLVIFFNGHWKVFVTTVYGILTKLKITNKVDKEERIDHNFMFSLTNLS